MKWVSHRWKWWADDLCRICSSSSCLRGDSTQIRNSHGYWFINIEDGLLQTCKNLLRNNTRWASTWETPPNKEFYMIAQPFNGSLDLVRTPLRYQHFTQQVKVVAREVTTRSTAWIKRIPRKSPHWKIPVSCRNEIWRKSGGCVATSWWAGASKRSRGQEDPAWDVSVARLVVSFRTSVWQKICTNMRVAISQGLPLLHLIASSNIDSW